MLSLALVVTGAPAAVAEGLGQLGSQATPPAEQQLTAQDPAPAAEESEDAAPEKAESDDPAKTDESVDEGRAAEEENVAEDESTADELGSAADEGVEEKANKDSSDAGDASESGDARKSGDEDPMEIAPFAIGPDGGTAPFVYWTVRDTDGNLVPGASFRFDYRNWTMFGGWSWTSGNNANPLSDCDGTCGNNSIDRDTDGGEFLLEHRATARNNNNSLSTSDNYRVTPVSAPPGYDWVSTDPRSINGNSNSANWSANGGQYDFGTFTVQQRSTLPICEAGYVYAVSATGQMQQVSPDGTVTNIGQPASGVSIFNGLGIGTGGSPVYAIERSAGSGNTQNGTVYSYDVTTGQWASTGASTSALGGNTGTNLIGGAVDLNTGLYYFGGFTSGGDFKLYQYNPTATPRISLKGTIVMAGSTSANGDIAFDAAGNLFVVHGSGTTTTVYSVTAANIAAASGGNIPSSQSASVTTMNNVNGVSFDASGRAFLGSGGEIRSYNMPDWSGSAVVTSSGLSSTDLASCSSPPTITIEKFVEGARVAGTDQFRLNLHQGAQLIGEATTTGNTPGLQAERVGPLPTVRGVALTFSEAAAGTTNLTDYVSSYRCLVDGVQTTQGNGTSGTITIPAGGQAVECRFYNAPLVADVTVSKTVLDANGENPQPGAGWVIGANVAPTAGAATFTPAAATRPTNAQGDASWSLRFNAASARATVTVSETQQEDHEFVSGVCEITPLDGVVRTVELTSEAGSPLTGIAPGDSVVCEYVNKVKDTALLTLVKDVAFGDAAAATWSLSATGPAEGLPGPNGQTGTAEATAEISTDVAYLLAEDDPLPTYVQSGTWVCVDENGETVAVTESAVTVTRPGAEVTCTVTNTTSRLTLLKHVPGVASFAVGDFTLTATPSTGVTGLSTLDAIGAETASAANTFDVRPEYAYTLSEESAASSLAYRNTELQLLTGTDPADDASWTTVTSAEITVAPGQHAVYRFVNEPVPSIVLPLTGGLSTDAFLIAGGAVLALALGLGGWHLRRSRRSEMPA